MSKFGFDINEYEAPAEFGIMPEGEYRLRATEAEDKETSSGGEMIAATFVVIEPAEFKNRKVWMNFNTVNKSEKAQNFGRRMIAGWARAAGKPNAKSTDELLEKPFWAKLGVEAGSGQYKDKNIITSFLMPEGATSAAPAAKSSAKDSAPAEGNEEAAAPAAKVEKASAGAKSTPTPAATGKKPNPWD